MYNLQVVTITQHPSTPVLWVLDFTIQQPNMQLGRQLFHCSPSNFISIKARRTDRTGGGLVNVESHLGPGGLGLSLLLILAMVLVGGFTGKAVQE